MIVPVDFVIERLNEPESYGVELSDLVISVPTPPRYRVTATVLDTEAGKTMTYTFHSMVDPTAAPGQEIGVINHEPWQNYEKHLTNLRDELDELLGDASE